MTILFSTSNPKIAKSDTFGRKFKDFYFANYALRQFKGVDFKYDNGFFKFQPENTQIKQFFALNVSFFIHFCMKLISKMVIVSFKFQPKISKYEIFFEN